MLTRMFLIVSLFSLCFYLYGVLFTLLNIEENNCKMTYMYEYPQFVRIHFKENEDFPKYGLYAYAEGRYTQLARSKIFTGAPIIFVPGNSGSHKQARSLASIALQKGINNNWKQHLDYFTIDFNEEYSGLFGGYLENQKEFLKHSILTVLDLYKNLENRPKQVVLIGHSMGGKIAQSILADANYSKYVNTLITIASPIDRPVLNFDPYLEAFYRHTENTLSKSMRTVEVSNTTNYCGKQASTYVNSNQTNENIALHDKLFITIGGGSRDMLVRSGLTSSKYSDIHALSTSIPYVWLSTDHLCAVWCRELMLVINRFLFDIIEYQKQKNAYKLGQDFIKEKDLRLAKASYHFVKSTKRQYRNEINLVNNERNIGDWVEDSRRVFNVVFKGGLKQTRFQMIRLIDIPQHQILTAEAVNIEGNDWVFGCSASYTEGNMRYCSQATSLTHLVSHLPSAKHERYFLSVDLHKLMRANTNWTHVVLRILPSKESMWVNVDIHSPADRQMSLQMPKWYYFSRILLREDTMLGSSFYRVALTGLEESHQALELELTPKHCSSANDHAVAEICIPWARGSQRFQYVTYGEHKSILIDSPISKPLKYNTTDNPIYINLHLDPTCRYSLSMKNSFGGTLSRIVLQYSHWLPSHFAAILFLALRYQLTISPSGADFKCGKLHSALLNCSPFFIITATRIFAKLLEKVEALPNPDDFHQSIMIAVIVHGSALALLSLGTAAIWLGITICGSMLHKIIFKMVQLPIPTISSALIPIIQKIPLSAVVVIIAIAFASCGGLGLLCACVVHFILMTKKYEDFLEEFVHNTAKVIAQKLFGKKSEDAVQTEIDDSSKTEEIETKDDEEQTESKNDAPVPGETEAAKMDIELKERQPDEIKTNDEIKPDHDQIVVKTDLSGLGLSKSDEDALARIDQLNDEELDKLLRETIEKQQEINRARKETEAAKRKEYNSVHDGLSSINFHMTLLLLLLLTAVLNLPATISWAKNYNYSHKLVPDPSLIPGTVILVSLGVIWQMNTPRNIYAYRFISVILYVLAAVCVIYCQDSIFRLNAIISTAFGFIALHQLVAPKLSVPDNEADDKILENQIQRMREILIESNNISE